MSRVVIILDFREWLHFATRLRSKDHSLKYFLSSYSDSVKSKKYDLPTAASIQAMQRGSGNQYRTKYGPDDLYATEV